MVDETGNIRTLTPEEVEIIKKQLLDSIYADIGKSIVKKLLWVGGVLLLILVAFLTGSGHIKL